MVWILLILNFISLPRVIPGEVYIHTYVYIGENSDGLRGVVTWSRRVNPPPFLFIFVFISFYALLFLFWAI